MGRDSSDEASRAILREALLQALKDVAIDVAEPVTRSTVIDALNKIPEDESEWFFNRVTEYCHSQVNLQEILDTIRSGRESIKALTDLSRPAPSLTIAVHPSTRWSHPTLNDHATVVVSPDIDPAHFIVVHDPQKR